MNHVPRTAQQVIDDSAATIKLIGKEFLRKEIDLVTLKWPSYRFMTPLEATRIFADLYKVAYIDCVRENLDIEHAEKTKIGAKLSWKERNSDLTQMWIARQHADELGMPYPDYLEFAFKFAVARQRRRLPQPNQLRPSSEAQTVAWNAKLAEFWTEDRIDLAFQRMPALPQYTATNFCESAAQIAYRDQLISYGKKNTITPWIFVRRYLLQRAEITEANCIEIFGAMLFDEVLATALRNRSHSPFAPIVHSPLATIERAQSCFSLFLPNKENHDQCKLCPLVKVCEKTHELVRANVAAATGSVDPLREHQLKQQRDRTSRCRAKKQITGAELASNNLATKPHIHAPEESEKITPVHFFAAEIS